MRRFFFATPVGAICALRWNYRWAEVFVWLRAQRVTLHGVPLVTGRGWWLVIRHPSQVVAEQDRLASGAVL